MEVKGCIIAVGERRSDTTERGTWTRREFVLEYGNITYSKKISFTLKGANVDKFENLLHIGKKVKVVFDIEAMMSRDGARYWNSVNAYAMEELVNTSPVTQFDPNCNDPL